ncbi:MAG TPA: hypothetical protein VMY36_04730 [Patescibacteria group bacterium]|nr:hypothetical protein [Patescibacteria group bacterium]
MDRKEEVRIGCLILIIVVTGIVAALVGSILIFPINRTPVIGLIIGVVAFVISFITAIPEPRRTVDTRDLISGLFFCVGFILAGLSLLWMGKLLLKADVIAIITMICDLIWGLILIGSGAHELYVLFGHLRQKRKRKGS